MSTGRVHGVSASPGDAWTGRRSARRLLLRGARRLALACCAGGLLGVTALAQTPEPAQTVYGPSPRGVEEWLERLQQGTTVASYVGTYVVSSASGAMSSARIWHACEGRRQFERVDTLSGVPRSTFRRDDWVTTLLPQSRLMRSEQRVTGGVFPNLLRQADGDTAADHYRVREAGRGRVAGLDADIVLFRPRDELRFGYRIWSERQTGLVLKIQTLDATGRVLEQAAFSELQIDVPIDAVRPHLELPDASGFRSERVERQPVDMARSGWAMREPVAGFQPQAGYQRDLSDEGETLQWVFSDGLATVSLFIEPYDLNRHRQPGVSAMGATHAVSQRWPDEAGAWWLTLVGEVPQLTLTRLAQGLARDEQ